MKKLGIVASLGLLLAGGVYWYLSRPATVVVQIILAETGFDVTDRYSLAVGPVSDATQGAPNILNVSARFPVEGTQNTFSVAPREDIGIVANARYAPTVERIETFAPGETRSVVIEVDAAALDLTLRSDNEGWMGQRRLLVNDASITGWLWERDTPEQFIVVPPGTHRIAATHGLQTDAQVVEVASGDRVAMQFDTRIGDLDVEVSPASSGADQVTVLLTYLGPRESWATSKVGHSLTFEEIPYGDYEIVVIVERGTMTPVRSEAVAVSLEGPEGRVVVPHPQMP